MTRGYRSWFQDLINLWTVPATVLKNNYVQAIHSQCRVCKLKMLYMFKTFVSLLSGQAPVLCPSLLLSDFYQNARFKQILMKLWSTNFGETRSILCRVSKEEEKMAMLTKWRLFAIYI